MPLLPGSGYRSTRAVPAATTRRSCPIGSVQASCRWRRADPRWYAILRRKGRPPRRVAKPERGEDVFDALQNWRTVQSGNQPTCDSPFRLLGATSPGLAMFLRVAASVARMTARAARRRRLRARASSSQARSRSSSTSRGGIWSVVVTDSFLTEPT